MSPTSLFLAIFVSLLIGLPAKAQSPTNSLEVMKGQYEAMLEIACEPYEERRQMLFDQYAVAVERLGNAFEEKGDAVNAAEALREAELARTSRVMGDAAFPGVSQVREKLNQESAKIDEAIVAKKKSIQGQYLQRLKGLRLSLLTEKDSAGAEAVMAEARRVSAGGGTDDSRPAKSWRERNWPIDRGGSLVFGWKQGMEDEATLGGGLSRSKVMLKQRGAAIFDEAGSMQLVDGSIHASRASRHLLSTLGRAGELTLEVVFSSSDLLQRGPARIVTFSSNGSSRNFTLGQTGETMVLRLRTPITGLNGGPPETEICEIQVDSTYHLLVTYRPGELVAYLDGEEVLRSNEIEGDFSNWDAEQELVFGDEFYESRNWDGSIEGVAISNQFTDFEAALENYRAASGLN